MWEDPYAKGHTVCPVHCNQDEMLCSGGVDLQGWPMEDFCIPMMYDDCPTFCPAICDQASMKCPGQVDAKGCWSEDFCIPMDPYCPANCPVYCNEYEMPCSGGYDYHTGCPMPDTCVPAKD